MNFIKIKRGYLISKFLSFVSPTNVGIHFVLLVLDSHLLAGRKLMETDLSLSNILVLAIKRGFHLIAAPKAEEEIRAGDRLVCFGYLKGMSKLARQDEKNE